MRQKLNKDVVLIAARDGRLRAAWRRLLADRGSEVIEVLDVTSVLESAQARPLDLIILGASLSRPRDSLDVVRRIRSRDSRVPIILVTSAGCEELAIASFRAGVTDYLNERSSLEELAASIDRCLFYSLAEDAPEAHALPKAAPGPTPFLVGQSTGIRDIKAYIAKLAATDCCVLITGETGTGKELVAQLIHATSERRRKPFACINCAAIPDTLVESELFGYERGAFTGASGRYEGQLKLADAGTVFFDEIGDMSPYAQAKILRVIEGRAIHRLGGRRGIPLDIRIIAATNQDLERLVADGKFRRDLYFRLNVARIHLPPLRDRREDIPLLVEHFIDELNRRYRTAIEGLDDDALEVLFGYDWPGNIRELRNVLEAVFLTRPPRRISRMALPESFRQRTGMSHKPSAEELDRLLTALYSTNWNKSRAAKQLQWSRMTLYRKMAKYRLASPEPAVHADTSSRVSQASEVL